MRALERKEKKSISSSHHHPSHKIHIFLHPDDNRVIKVRGLSQNFSAQIYFPSFSAQNKKKINKTFFSCLIYQN